MPNDPVNTGPRPAKIDGKDILLTPLSADAMSAISAFVFKNKQPKSMYETVLRFIDRVPEDLREKQLNAAMKCDHEELLRERFNDLPRIPKQAFFDADVVAMVLTFSASPEQPEYSLERCNEIAKRLGPEVILSQIMWVFPSEPEKKGQDSSDSSGAGTSSTGLSDAPLSLSSLRENLT